MPDDVLHISDQPGSDVGQRVLTLSGPLTLRNVFDFQAMVRADQSRALIIDFAGVPYVDSAGIGALVGAYVTRQNSGRKLALTAVSKRVHDALKVTRVEQFFKFYDSAGEAQQALVA